MNLRRRRNRHFHIIHQWQTIASLSSDDSILLLDYCPECNTYREWDGIRLLRVF